MTQLLDLPAEVLHLIYDWLRRIETAAYNPRFIRGPDDPPRFTYQFISHAMHPYTQAYRLHTPRVMSKGELANFEAVVEGSHLVRNSVRAVVLDGTRHHTHPTEEERANPNLSPAGSRIWHQLPHLRSASFRCFEGALGGLLEAIVLGGVRLAELTELGIVNCLGPSNDQFSIELWHGMLAAMPNLTRLELTCGCVWQETWSLPILVVAPTFATKPTFLKLSIDHGTHEPTVATFVNAFDQLEMLELSVTTLDHRSELLPLLCLPVLRTLSYRWRALDEDVAGPLDELDLRHFPVIQFVTLVTEECAPDFRLLLPPHVHHLRLEEPNQIPIAALHELITPGTRNHRPALQHIHLNLTFGEEWWPDVEHMPPAELNKLDLDSNGCDGMEWTAAVSRVGLEELLRVADEQGVEMTGTFRAALRLEEAREARWRAKGGRMSVAWLAG